MSAEEEFLKPGTVIGSYRVAKKIGEGGMGTVYDVEHTALGVHYAMKVFRSRKSGENFAERFETEGRLLARLSHPNLVRVFDLKTFDLRPSDLRPSDLRPSDQDGGFAYYVMDLVASDGGMTRTLANIEPGDVDEAVLVDWFRQLCSAVDYIHANGVVHRDIKSGNILLAQGNRPVLSDFGVSCIIADGLRETLGAKPTREQPAADSPYVIGTEGFMSPELKRGGAATPSADVYALGVVFFRMLTGIWYDSTLEPGSVSSIRTGVDAVRCLENFKYNWVDFLPAMLAANPDSRPSSLEEVAATLHSRVDHDSPPPAPDAHGATAGDGNREGSRPSSRLAWVWGAVAAFAVSAAVAMFLVMPRRTTPPQVPVPSFDEVYSIPASIK